VVLPRLAVTPARADVSVTPRDANPKYGDVACTRRSPACNEPPARHGRIAELINCFPRRRLNSSTLRRP
jgi:hypothetical protein